MPIYEYRCGNCGEVNEFLVLDRNEELNCKSCNSKNLDKLLSAHNTIASSHGSAPKVPGSCCGTPDSCGSPGSCCSG